VRKARASSYSSGVAFTPVVKAIQTRKGSRSGQAWKGAGGGSSAFGDIFNNQRPHEALGMKCPAEVYQPSTRSYQGLPDIDYPFHDKSRSSAARRHF
jgi:hypothetical protein